VVKENGGEKLRRSYLCANINSLAVDTRISKNEALFLDFSK
jgi:hypothetical protein